MPRAGSFDSAEAYASLILAGIPGETSRAATGPGALGRRGRSKPKQLPRRASGRSNNAAQRGHGQDHFGRGGRRRPEVTGEAHAGASPQTNRRSTRTDTKGRLHRRAADESGSEQGSGFSLSILTRT